jgi:hypothetical protein
LDASSAATTVAAIPTHIAKLQNKHTQSNSLSQDRILKYPKDIERTQLKTLLRESGASRLLFNPQRPENNNRKKKKSDRAQVTYLPATKRTTRNTDDRIVLAITAAYPKNTTKKSAGKIRKKPTTNSSNAPNECCKFATTRGIQQEFATSVAKKDSTQKSQIAMRNRARFKKIRTLAAAATAELLPLSHLRCFPTPRLSEHSRCSQIYHVAPIDPSSTSRKWLSFALIGGLC